MLGSLVLTTLVLEVPFIANMFGFTPITLPEYLVALALAVGVKPNILAMKGTSSTRVDVYKRQAGRSCPPCGRGPL